MFKELHPLAEGSPVLMLVNAEGEKLRVTITQKETKKGTPLALSILATPAELDAELPAAIAGAMSEPDAGKPVADQVRDQVTNAKPKKAERPAAAKAVKSTAPKPAASKPEAPAKAKPPGKKEQRAACIADYVALHMKHGDKLTRDVFCKEAATTRSYERLFGGWTKFAKAGKAAALEAAPNRDDKTKPRPLDEAAVATESATPQAPCTYDEANPEATDPGTTPAPNAQADSVKPTPAGSQRTGEDLGEGEHLVPAQPAAAADTESAPNAVEVERVFTEDDPEVLSIAAGTNTDPVLVAADLNGHAANWPAVKFKSAKPWTCVDEDGVYVSIVEAAPDIGATLTLELAKAVHGRTSGEFEVLTVAPTRKTITVRAVLPPPPADWPFPTTPLDVTLGQDKHDTSHGHTAYDQDGNMLSGITGHVEVGGEIFLTHGRFVVTSIDGARVIVAPAVTAETVTAKDFKPERNVVTMDGSPIAEGWAIEVEPGTEFDVPGYGKVRVRVANDEKIFVERIEEAPPPMVRKIIDGDGENLGTHEGEVGAWLQSAAGLLKVVRTTAKAIFVEPVTVAEEA